ncbi:MAG TPA: DUF4468 domain-containing protein [Cytophagales bacterium]|nr:DUF4468 domain-containing protein [Cytophagales bacterium]
MKYLIAFLCFTAHLIGAQIILPIDSSTGKVTYYEVVKTDTSLSKAILLINAEKWAEKNLKVEEIKADSHKIVCVGLLGMSESKGILEKNSGRFTYDFILEVKDAKYRYMFTNFVYNKYTVDKNGKRQYEHKKHIEEPKAPGWNKLWNKHKATLDQQIRALIVDLKEQMNVNPSIAPIELKIKQKSNDW